MKDPYNDFRNDLKTALKRKKEIELSDPKSTFEDGILRGTAKLANGEVLTFTVDHRKPFVSEEDCSDEPGENFFFNLTPDKLVY